MPKLLAATPFLLAVLTLTLAPVVSAVCSDHNGSGCAVCTADPECGYCGAVSECVEGNTIRVDPDGDNGCAGAWVYGFCGSCGDHEYCLECYSDPGMGPCPDCTGDRPVRCPSGVCVASPDLCPTRLSCSATPGTPVLCRDGSCVTGVANVTDCPSTCASVNQRCSDGSCATDLSTCPATRDCELPARLSCADGSCVPADNSRTCSPPGPCLPGQTRCDDGVCRSNSASCPPSNRCPASAPYRCGSGRCAADYADCAGACTGVSEQECFDGSCELYGDACIMPVRLAKILPVRVEMDASENAELSLLDDAASRAVRRELVKLMIPRPAWGSATGSTVMLTAEPVAESVLRATEGTSGWSEQGYEANVFSPVFRLSWPESQQWGDEKTTMSIRFDNPDHLDTSLVELCLGYLDPATNKWICDDRTLSNDGSDMLTGRTDKPSGTFAVIKAGVPPADSPLSPGEIIGLILGGAAVLGVIVFAAFRIAGHKAKA